MAEAEQSTSILNVVLAILIFGGAFVALNFLVGAVFTLLKWAVVGAAAMVLTGYVLKRLRS